MPKVCVAVGCFNRHSKDNPISFYCFPTAKYHEARRKLWINAVNRIRENKTLWKPSKDSRICSAHFVTGKPSKFKEHPDFVPSIFAHKKKKKSTERFERSRIRKKCTDTLLVEHDEESKENGRIHLENSNIEEENAKMDAAQGLLQLYDFHPVQVHDFGKREGFPHPTSPKVLLASTVHCQNEGTPWEEHFLLKQEIQDAHKEIANLRKDLALCRESKLCLQIIRRDDKTFKYYTGLANHSIFDALFKLLGGNSINLTYWYGKKSNTSVASAETNDASKIFKTYVRNRKTSLQDELFMVLVRLRTGMPVKELCRNFNLKMSIFSSIFTTWILFLFSRLKKILIRFPTLKEVQQYLPTSFASFKNTRIVIDATEVRIQRPSSRTVQKQTFSNYKHYNTFKVLIGCTPDGYLNFISDLWTGSVSDKELVLRSGLLDLLNPGEAVMADKGFVIDDILPRGVVLHMPPLRYVNRGQMPKSDLVKTQSIASARVHVERLIRRIKEFHILDRAFPLSMGDLAQPVLTVCACLVNLQGPLIRAKTY